MTEAIAYAVYGGTCAVIAAIFARRKNRSVPLWAFLGFCFGVVGLTILALIDNAGIRWSVDRRIGHDE